MVDLVVVVALLLAALAGWRDGLITGALVMVGWLVGGLATLRYLPPVLARFHTAQPQFLALAQVLATFVGATLMAALMHVIAARVVRVTSSRRPLRVLDALAGAVASALVAATIVWAVATVVRPLLPAAASRQVAQARTLTLLDDVMPGPARALLDRGRGTLDQLGLPRVIEGLSPEPIVPVGPPDTAAAKTDAVRRASGSVLKVMADTPACGVTGQGSGWVVARGRVVTNAHVVQGSGDVSVQVTGQGRALPATVVAYDRKLDLAILAVPELQAPALPRQQDGLRRGAAGVVAGFPRDKGYTVKAARVRAMIDAVESQNPRAVSRQVYSLRTTVQPGNSGGPFLTPTGRVAGTVFARGTDDDSTGYALTDHATDTLLDRASRLTRPVDTGQCNG